MIYDLYCRLYVGADDQELWVSAVNASVEASRDGNACNKYTLLHFEEKRRMAKRLYLKNGSAINCVLNIVPICLEESSEISIKYQ